jgi:antitoxin component of MazEF toxin-antitoxin module
MPAKSEHKIMKHGTSGVVVIPKPYRDYHCLKPGSTVTVLYDSLLLIVPKSLEYLLKEKATLIDQLLGQTKPEASPAPA